MVSSAVTIVFVCWEIHKGKHMPDSCNKLAGKKMDECLLPPVPFRARALRTGSEQSHLHSPMLARAMTHPTLVCISQKTHFFQSLEMHFKREVQMFTLFFLPRYFHHLFHAFSLWCLREWKWELFGNFHNLWSPKAGRRNGNEDCCNLM